MIEMKIWVNKVKETTKTLEYKNSGNINIDIKYISNLSSNIREAWYKLGVKQLQPIYEDLFLLSLVIFAVDKRVPRSMFPDAWTRTIQVNVPMIKSDVWNSVINGMFVFERVNWIQTINHKGKERLIDQIT